MAKWERRHDKIIKELQKIGKIIVDSVWIKKYDNQTYHALENKYIINPLRVSFGLRYIFYLLKNNDVVRWTQYDMLSDKYLEKVLQGAIEAKKRGIK